MASIIYFSRIPVPSKINCSEIHYQHAVRYLPWVGFIVSSAGALAIYYAYYILPSTVAVIIGAAITIFLTGAFHEDGLADVCDGFGGGYSKKHILDIMKDSHIGTYGVIGLVLVFFFKIASLSAMPPFFVVVFFILGNTVSRAAIIPVIQNYSYVRDEITSKVHPVIGEVNGWDLFIGILPAIPVFWFINQLTSLIILLPVWITQWLLIRYFKRKIDGYTGDCLGAIQQICEVVFYISALVWLKYTW